MKIRAIAASLFALALLFTGSARAQHIAPTTTIDLLRELYSLGGNPALNETDCSVGTSPVLCLPSDPGRTEDVVSNTGTSSCSVSHQNTVTLAKGLLLAASGGFLSENFYFDFTLPTEQLWAVCSASGGTLHIITVNIQ